MQHASIWGPSGSEKRLICPGSYRAELGRADQDSSFAREGSAAHELAAAALTEGRPCRTYIGQVFSPFDEWPVTEVMARYTQRYVRNMEIRAQCSDIAPMVETRVSIGRWAPGQFGTSDHITLAGKVLYVDDFKYGQGLKVGAKENAQGLCYALGTYDLLKDKYDIEQVTIGIHQPRLDWYPTWTCSIDYLLAFGERVRNGFEELFSLEPKRVASYKGCMFCKAKKTCGTYAKWVDEGRPGMGFTGPKLTVEQLAADFDID